MKFHCNPNDLSDALTTVSKALPLKPTAPVFEGILIVAKGDTLTLSAYNIDLFIEKKIKAEILLEGECLVNGKFITDFIRKIVGFDSIELEAHDLVLRVRYGENETSIQCMEPMYSMPADVNEIASFSIKEGDLRELIEKTIFCVALEDSRPILKGCLLEINGDAMTAVALDGYRLAVNKTAIRTASEQVSVIVPGKTLGEISKILTDDEEIVHAGIDERRIKFETGHTTIVSLLLEGKFIEYQKIVPAVHHTRVTVNKAELENGLDRAALVARNKKNNYVKLSVSTEGIAITSNSEIGAIKENVSATMEGKQLEIAFNSKYLFDAFSKIKEDFIAIEFAGSNAPAVIKPLEGDRYLYIVLPVRLMG